MTDSRFYSPFSFSRSLSRVRRDSVMKTMNVEKITAVMDKFEQQFESQLTTTTEGQLNGCPLGSGSLIQQEASRIGCGVEMPRRGWLTLLPLAL